MDAATSRLLREGAAGLGVALADAQVATFARYLDLLLKWNRRIKLTSVVEPTGIVEKHFIDSLAVVGELGDAKALVDVGSGAGFPGVPVAIARPSLRVTLVESIHKKAAFLEAARRELALANVEVFVGRMEELIRRERRFDVAVSRATLPPADWLREGGALVLPGGRLIAMVVPGDPLESLAPGWQSQYEAAHSPAPYAPGRSLVVLSGRRPG